MVPRLRVRCRDPDRYGNMEGLRELIDIDEKNVEHRTHDVIIVFANDGLLRTSYEKIPVNLFLILAFGIEGTHARTRPYSHSATKIRRK